MNPETLKLMKESAAKASPGPWQYRHPFAIGWTRAPGRVFVELPTEARPLTVPQAQQCENDYRFIALCDPTTISALVAEYERLKVVVDAAVEWRRVGYERKDEFALRIGPLLDAIDIYDVGHKRSCEEL